MKEKIKKFAKFPVLLAVLVASVAAAVATMFINTDSKWFSELTVPSFMPSSAIQIAFWCVSIGLLAAGTIILILKGKCDRKLYIMLGGVGVGAILYSLFLYTLENITWSVITIIALLVLSCYIMLAVKKKESKKSFFLFVAFTVWIAYMTIASLVLMLLN